MSLSAESKHRAMQAIIDALDLLGMANAAVHRARSEQKGHATARLAVVPVTSRSRAA
jgi:hypothetical protein